MSTCLVAVWDDGVYRTRCSMGTQGVCARHGQHQPHPSDGQRCDPMTDGYCPTHGVYMDPHPDPGPRRIRRHRTAGWRMPEGAVYVGRPTRWGNPFIVGGRVTVHADPDMEAGYTVDLDAMTPEQAVAGYRDLMQVRLNLYPGEDDPDTVARIEEWRAAVAGLRGHDLACWCPIGTPCHADVLLDLANPEGS